MTKVKSYLPKGILKKQLPYFDCLLDVESPSFGVTCPSDIRRFADRGKNYTTVTWDPVIATDNSGVAPNVVTSGVKSTYDKGKHVVMYQASDEVGNSKICKFHVSVLGRRD